MNQTLKTALAFAAMTAALSAQAARPIATRVMVDQTMFGSTPGSEKLVRATILNLAANLIPGLDTLRIGIICGQPQTVFDAKVTRSLKALDDVLKAQVLKPCSRKGSPLNAGLRWALDQPKGGLILITDTALTDDPASAQLPHTARQLTGAVLVIGAKSDSRDAFDRFLKGAPGYLGTYGALDAPQAVKLFLRTLRR